MRTGFLNGCLLVGCGLALAACLFWSWQVVLPRLTYSGPRPITDPLFLSRTRHVLKIRDALFHFEQEHEHWPESLSALVDGYVSRTNLALFYGATNVLSPSYHRPPGWQEDPKLADEAGAYVYLGSNGTKNGILLYERPGIWIEQRGLLFGKLLVVITNGAMVHYPRELFQNGVPAYTNRVWGP